MQNASKNTKERSKSTCSEVELEFMHEVNDQKASLSSERKELEMQLLCKKGKNFILSEKLADATMFSERTILAFNTQQDIVVAKQEIIENLKKEIGVIKKSPMVTATAVNSNVVRGNSCKIMRDLEILDTVKFLLFLVSRGPREPISVECKFFYPELFFQGGL